MNFYRLLFTKLTLVFALLFGSNAQSRVIVWDEGFSVKNATAFEVELLDDAKSACWTNLRETREYAEEKLKMLGAKIEEIDLPFASDKQYRLEVHVNLLRMFANNTGPCYGSINVSIITFALINGLYHKAEIITYDAILIKEQNLNQEVVSVLSNFFSHLK